MKIEEDKIPYTYSESKRVFENKLPIKEAAEYIYKKHGIKINSAIDYGYYFRYLMTGEGSCRSLSSYTQKYYLDRIQKEYSNDQFEKSLAHFKKLIDKFEGSKVGSKKSMRAIYDAYNK